MNKFIFLSHFLSEKTPGYGGNPAFFSRHVSSISQGQSSNSQEWRLSNHIGTHIDLPSHFDEGGKRLEDYKAKDWIFFKPFLYNRPAQANEIIGVSDALNVIPDDCDFLILKTGFQHCREKSTYWSNNPGLAPEFAQWIRENRPQIRVLGFDFISITSFPNRPLGRVAHRAFLGLQGAHQPLRVIEDMDLAELDRSPKQIIVSPLMVAGADGAPVTVIAAIE